MRPSLLSELTLCLCCGSFYSLFNDSDSKFGSNGSVGYGRKEQLAGGVYEVNPPFGVDLHVLADWLAMQLDQSDDLLEFIVVMPEPMWDSVVKSHEPLQKRHTHCQVRDAAQITCC